MISSSNTDKVILIGGSKVDFAALELPTEQMPYLMLETAEHGIEFGAAADFNYVPDWTMLRLHAFGPGGDLLIRRDENQVFWRFVGYEGVFNLLGLTEGIPYSETLIPGDEDERSLLWGAFDEQRGYWHDNRVGKAHLAYPFDHPAERVEIRACPVLDAKTQETVAYWTYTLAEHVPPQEIQ